MEEQLRQPPWALQAAGQPLAPGLPVAQPPLRARLVAGVQEEPRQPLAQAAAQTAAERLPRRPADSAAVEEWLAMAAVLHPERSAA